MDNNWPVTVFILNLAFADLMYCSINLPIVVIQKLNQDWTLDLPTCRCLTNIRYRWVCFDKYSASNINNLKICFSNAYADWMSLAMIAASLCSEVTSLGQQTIFSSRRNRILILIFIRIYGFVLLIPTNLGVSF